METHQLLDRHSILSNKEEAFALQRAVVDKDIASIFSLVENEDLRSAVLSKNPHAIFRILGDEHEDLRKVICEKNWHALFRILGDEYEDLRKTILEKNLHALFRILEDEHEDLRKAMLEKNFHALFRILGDEYEDLRKAMLEKNFHSLFRIVDNEDLGKAVNEENLHSIFRLLGNDDLKKAVLNDDTNALYRILKLQGASNVISIIKKHDLGDAISRGQILSKKWLIEQVKNMDLGTVWLCAGWYGTLATMMFEAECKVKNIYSFDVDQYCLEIAEDCNRPWVTNDWKFKASTADIYTLKYKTGEFVTKKSNGDEQEMWAPPDTIINTSCEHIDPIYWAKRIPEGIRIIAQSNNMKHIEEHQHCVNSVEELLKQIKLTNIEFAGSLPLPGGYTRFMVIGYK